jgi:hypothetical protein
MWPQHEVIARLRPSLMMTILRRTRVRDVRGWSEEPGERLALAAVALEALHRPRQAAAMYRLAMKHTGYLREELRTRLDALGLAEDLDGAAAE